VQMKVKDALPGIGTGVGKHTIPRFGDSLSSGDVRGDCQQFTAKRQIVRSKVIQRSDMTTRDDQNVSGCLWMEIAKGNNGIRLHNELSSEFAPRDLTENTIVDRLISCHNIRCHSFHSFRCVAAKWVQHFVQPNPRNGERMPAVERIVGETLQTDKIISSPLQIRSYAVQAQPRVEK
jgi:hypothetical protein